MPCPVWEGDNLSTSFRELIRTAIAEYLRRHEGGR